MAQQMFNIDQDVLEEFRRLHKGDMSALVSDMIKGYLNIKNENLQLDNMKEKLAETQREIQRLKREESNYRLLITELEKEYERQMQSFAREDRDISEWAKDIIADAKRSGDFTNLQYLAEKEGYLDVQDYLIAKWKEEKKNG